MPYRVKEPGRAGKLTLKTDTTMEQKINWMRFLIIGISLIFSSCGEGIIEYSQTANYIYINKHSEEVTLRLKAPNYPNATKLKYRLYSLKPNDSIYFTTSGSPSAYPFSGGDVFTIKYQNKKCTQYKQMGHIVGGVGGNGVFNLKNYDNYSIELVQQRKYTLRYLIDKKDYAAAKDCE